MDLTVCTLNQLGKSEDFLLLLHYYSVLLTVPELLQQSFDDNSRSMQEEVYCSEYAEFQGKSNRKLDHLK